MVEVLPQVLTWAPECNQPRACYSGHIYRLKDEKNDVHLRGGEYEVPHYGSPAYGQAFGPLGLDQVVQFCHLLGERIAQHGSVVLVTPPGDIPERANTAVLLGVYLMLRQGWTFEMVCKTLAEEAYVGFPCSWANRSSYKKVSAVQASAEAVMEVRDCWSGLEMARKRRWVPSEAVLSDRVLTDLFCSQHRRQAMEYDACWLEPGHILVCADPTTTIRDPNPMTCSSMEPRPTVGSPTKPTSDRPQLMAAAIKKHQMQVKLKTIHSAPILHLPFAPGDSDSDRTPEEAWDNMSFRSDSNASSAPTRCHGPTPQQEAEAAELGHPSQVDSGSGDGAAQSNSGSSSGSVGQTKLMEIAGRQETPFVGPHNDASSCHTVCKFQVAGDGPTDTAVDQRRGRPKDFMSFCKDRKVKTVLRVNRGNEAGLLEFGGTYDRKVFVRHGIHQLDVPVDDKCGGVPSASHIAAAMRGCERHVGGEDKAVLVHCKGGFGRSVVFACCLMIWEHDLPGRQMLGWVRVVRPGAICTTEQEQFLCKLKGREDLRRHIGAHAGTQACCTIS